MAPYIKCSAKIIHDVPYVTIKSCNKCEPECVGNYIPSETKYTPLFNSTYVGRATSHYPTQNLDYYDCNTSINGKCGPRCEGRCEMVCNTIPQARIKNNILKHNSNYIGTSKRMAYGKYMNTTPGMETFASKKVVALQPIVKKNAECFEHYWCKNL